MTLSILDRYITQTDSGITVPSAVVTIYTELGVEADLFEDKDGVIPTDNPVTADANGRIKVYMLSGKYSASAAFGGDVVNYPDILVGGKADETELTINTVKTNTSDYLNAIRNQNTVSDLVNMSGSDISILYSSGQNVITRYNNITSKKGGASYTIKTLEEAADDGDIIDGTGYPLYLGGNHALSDGVHCAILEINVIQKASFFGAVSDASASGFVTDNIDALDLAHAYCNRTNAELAIDGQFGIRSQWVLTGGAVTGSSMAKTGIWKEGDFSGIKFLGENGTYSDFFCRGITGNESSDSGHGFLTIDGELAKRMRMSRLFAADHGGNGFDMGGGNLSEYTSLLSVSNVGDGFRFGGFDANGCTAINLDARNNGGYGVRNNGAYNFIALGGYTTNNALYGWYIGENDGKYFGIGGEADGDKTLLMIAGKARNYIVLGVSGDYDDLSSSQSANTIIGTRDNTKLFSRSVTVKNGDANEGGILLASTSSGVIGITKDNSTRDLKVSMTGTSATASIDMSSMGSGKGLIVRDVADGNKYLIRVNNGVIQAVNIGV